LLLGLLLVVEAKLIQLVDELVGLLDVDVLKLCVIASGRHLVVITELK
jgi:hypothetical protein